MKPVPPDIEASGPAGTQWFGGPVDRSTVTMRIGCGADECEEVSRSLSYSGSEMRKRWRLSAQDSAGADLDQQVSWILSQLTSNLAVWKSLSSKYKIDVFCGLFLDRPNRGVTLSADTMRKLAERGIGIGFDIYAPDGGAVEQAVVLKAPADGKW